MKSSRGRAHLDVVEMVDDALEGPTAVVAEVRAGATAVGRLGKAVGEQLRSRAHCERCVAARGRHAFRW